MAFDAEPPMTGLALFHAQQAAEKALKGFLISRGALYPLSHDVRRLLELATPFDPTLGETIAPAAQMTPFALRYRYPGLARPLREEVLPWLDLAQTVYDEILRRLPPAG